MPGTYFTADEAAAIEAGFPDDGVPIMYCDVSYSQLSLARHAGGAMVHGRRFTYVTATDELIRDDLLKWIERRRREARRVQSSEFIAAQMGLL